MPTIQSYRDLQVFKLAFENSMKVFRLTKKFPKEEMYSLTDQVRRSSRSITANITEGWSKRNYENIFRKHLYDALGSCDETRVWLDYALECKYILPDEYAALWAKYDELGRKLTRLIETWKSFEPSKIAPQSRASKKEPRRSHPLQGAVFLLHSRFFPLFFCS